MIARITVGSGNSRTVITMNRDKDTRRELSNKLKGSMFKGRDYHIAKARGERSLAA